MSNIKTKYNNYQDLDHYNGPKCTNPNSISYPQTVYKRWPGSQENFVSLSAAIRRPFSPGFYDPNYVQPKVAGVN